MDLSSRFRLYKAIQSRLNHLGADELDIYMVSDLHVTHPLVYSSPRLNVWHDTFAALETSCKGRNSLDAWRGPGRWNTQERNSTFRTSCYIIFLKPRCQGSFISSCGLLVSYVILMLILNRHLRSLFPFLIANVSPYALTLSGATISPSSNGGLGAPGGHVSHHFTNPVATTYTVLGLLRPIYIGSSNPWQATPQFRQSALVRRPSPEDLESRGPCVTAFPKGGSHFSALRYVATAPKRPIPGSQLAGL